MLYSNALSISQRIDNNYLNSDYTTFPKIWWRISTKLPKLKIFGNEIQEHNGMFETNIGLKKKCLKPTFRFIGREWHQCDDATML